MLIFTGINYKIFSLITAIASISCTFTWSQLAGPDFGHQLGHWINYNWCSSFLNEIRSMLFVFPLLIGIAMFTFIDSKVVTTQVGFYEVT